MNEFTNVKVLSNPYKVVNFKGTFTDSDTALRCEFFPEQINFSQGIWQVALKDILIINKRNEPIRGVFDVKTDLVFNYEINETVDIGRSQFQSVWTSLFSADINFKTSKSEYIFFGDFHRVFHQLDLRPASFFTISFDQRSFVPQTIVNRRAKFNFDIEVNFLFQRVK